MPNSEYQYLSTLFTHARRWDTNIQNRISHPTKILILMKFVYEIIRNHFSAIRFLGSLYTRTSSEETYKWIVIIIIIISEIWACGFVSHYQQRSRDSGSSVYSHTIYQQSNNIWTLSTATTVFWSCYIHRVTLKIHTTLCRVILTYERLARKNEAKAEFEFVAFSYDISRGRSTSFRFISMYIYYIYLNIVSHNRTTTTENGKEMERDKLGVNENSLKTNNRDNFFLFFSVVRSHLVKCDKKKSNRNKKHIALRYHQFQRTYLLM